MIISKLHGPISSGKAPLSLEIDLENLAVAKVTTVIARCPHLKSFVNSADTTPFTDGHIEVYSAAGYANDHWVGRVDVQIKGKCRKKKEAQLQTYPVKLLDLRAYRRMGGALYFVGAVDPNKDHTALYYALLTPLRITEILEKVPESQAKVSIHLRKFPSTPKEIESIFRVALSGQNQRDSIVLDDELWKRFRSLTITPAEPLNISAPVTLEPETHDYTLEFKTTDGLVVPVHGALQVFPAEYVERELKVTIGSGDVEFESASFRRVDECAYEIRPATGVALEISSEDGRVLSISLEPTSILRHRARALEFYSAIARTGAIAFNGSPSAVVLADEPHTSTLIAHLEFIKPYVDLFEALHVDTSLIDLSTISDTEVRQLRSLYRALVEKEEFPDQQDRSGRVLQRLGPWSLMLFITSGEKVGTWRYLNPFELGQGRILSRRMGDEGGEQGEIFQVTVFDVVETEHLPYVLNLNLASVVHAYSDLPDLPKALNMAGQQVLRFIEAADLSEPRRAEFLDAARNLLEWLMHHEGEEPHHLLNLWQIEWRFGPLPLETRDAIRLLRRNASVSRADDQDEIEVACALLLEDSDGVDFGMRQLTEEARLKVAAWPIWRLRSDGASIKLANSAQSPSDSVAWKR